MDIPKFPMKAWHPVHGMREFKNAEEMQKETAGDEHSWKESAALADQARTQREADMVVHHNQDVKAEEMKKEDDVPVRNSVQAQESLDAGKAEPI